MKTKSRISVIVNGAMGKMGSTVISAVDKSDDMKIVGAVDVKSKKNQITLPYSGDVIEIKSSFTELLDQIKPNVIVDFTNGNVANKIFIESIKRGISVVSGSTGLSDKDLTEINWAGNSVLLFGSEGFGMKKHTEKYTDFLVKIEINKKIESLNISNSSAIVFHYVKKKKEGIT